MMTRAGLATGSAALLMQHFVSCMQYKQDNSAQHYTAAQAGAAAAEAARAEHEATQGRLCMAGLSGSLDAAAESTADSAPPAVTPLPPTVSEVDSGSAGESPKVAQRLDASPRRERSQSIGLQVGVLHFTPSFVPFPLLAAPRSYEPNTYDLSDPEEREFWLTLLASNVPNVVEKACLSSGPKHGAERRARALGKALQMHFERLKTQPELYGPIGLAEIFDLREACLREFKFFDIHQCALAPGALDSAYLSVAIIWTSGPWHLQMRVWHR